MAHGGFDLWLCIFSNTASLTQLTPVFDCSSHTWPVASLPDQLSSALDTLMAMVVVQLLKHFLPQALWKNQLVNMLSTIRPLVCPIQEVLFHHEVAPLAQQPKGCRGETQLFHTPWHPLLSPERKDCAYGGVSTLQCNQVSS